MDKQYEVTIGIPVYNIEKYIGRGLESVLAQTFNSLEILVCDDCGTDSSIDIVRKYQMEHPRGNDIRIVKQPSNLGLGEGRNRMISEARGKYIYFMDGDDSIEPDTIQILYSNAQMYNAQIVYGSFNRIEEFDNETRFSKFQYPSKKFLKENELAFFAYEEYGRMIASTCNFLIDINVYKKNGIKYKPINFWEDFTTTIDLPTYIDRAVLLSDLTYNYYCRYGSLSNYQKRSEISKSEILKTVSAIEEVKQGSERLKDKPYFSGRMCKVMMTCFFMACSILRNEKIISPEFSKKELSSLIRSPRSFRETIGLDYMRAKNIFLYILGVMPASISIFLIRKLGHRKGLI